MCTSRMQVFQVVCKVKLFIWPCTIYLLSLPVAKCLVCLSEARTVSLSATSLPPYTQTQQSFFVLLCQEISGHNIEKMGKKGGERIKRLDSASVGDYSKPVCRFSKCERVDNILCSTCSDKKRNKKETSERNTTTCRARLTSNSCCEHLNKLIGSTCDKKKKSEGNRTYVLFLIIKSCVLL